MNELGSHQLRQSVPRRVFDRGILLLAATAIAACDPAIDARRTDHPASDADMSADASHVAPPRMMLDSGPVDSPADAGAIDVAVPEPSILRIAVISDLNGSYGSTTYAGSVHRATARLIELNPDVVLVTGDMVAGQQAGLDYQAMWAGFHDAVTDPLTEAGIPLAVTPGNHDASGYAGYAAEREIFVSEWQPERRPAVRFLDDNEFPLRYSFTLGDVLFVSLDATTVGALSAEEHDWIEAQLIAGVDYAVKIVFGHLPLYPVAQGRESEVLDDPELEELLNVYQVDAYLSGHHHAWYPGARGSLRLVHLACLGAGPRRLLGQAQTSPRSFAWIEIRDGAIDRIDAFEGVDYDRVSSRDDLPESIGAEPRRIVRDDQAE